MLILNGTHFRGAFLYSFRSAVSTIFLRRNDLCPAVSAVPDFYVVFWVFTTTLNLGRLSRFNRTYFLNRNGRKIKFFQVDRFITNVIMHSYNGITNISDNTFAISTMFNSIPEFKSKTKISIRFIICGNVLLNFCGCRLLLCFRYIRCRWLSLVRYRSVVDRYCRCY